MITIEGEVRAQDDLKFAIVLSRFNEFVGKNLLEGALDTLIRHGVKDENITLVRVPGAFEIPLTVRTLAQSGQFSAIVCLGAVIRGSTGHYEYVAGQMAAGIMGLSLSTGVPIAFGVLTTDNTEQAIERAGGKGGNKGADAAMVALEMADLQRRLK